MTEQMQSDQVNCPFCDSTDIEMIALFGMQLMTSQYYCRHCHSAFEAVKWVETKTPENTERTEKQSEIEN